MEIEILSASDNQKAYGKCQVKGGTTIAELKKHVHKMKPSLIPDRQSIKLDVKGRSVKDSDTMDSLKLRSGGKVYVKDLGPQIGWKTVFLVEYAGPVFVYLWIYSRPSIIYSQSNGDPHQTVSIAAACWTLHYAKRILETLFVHRFSHATMPIRNLFKNCAYYWAFAGYVAYHVNHPNYTSPSTLQVYVGLIGFLISELGNLSIHLSLRNLRPAGTNVRKIPKPDGNPLTNLFNYVSCPNYTYEFFSWLSFSIMTQCLPALIFTAAGMYQMTMWAFGKHRNYRKEFTDYPKKRRAILPFIC